MIQNINNYDKYDKHINIYTEIVYNYDKIVNNYNSKKEIVKLQ